MPRASQTPATGDLFRLPAKGKREPEGWPPDDLLPGSLNEARTVFGEGAARASMMLVGEQPGDQEDLQGHVFVGPAGKVLDRALAEAGIARDTLYVTNGVKHFKNELRGKKRLHKRPDVR